MVPTQQFLDAARAVPHEVLRRRLEDAQEQVRRLEEAKKVSQETMRLFIGPGRATS